MIRLLLLLIAMAALAYFVLRSGNAPRPRSRHAVRDAAFYADPDVRRWEDAWRRASLRGGIRKRVMIAHEMCTRLLRLARIQSMPAHIVEFSDAMLRRVPDIIDEHLNAAQGGTADESDDVFEHLALTLEQWAEGAERHRKEGRLGIWQKLDVARRYTRIRTGKDEAGN